MPNLQAFERSEYQQVKAAVEFAGLPSAVPRMPIDQLMKKMYSDKKNIRGFIEYDLLRRIGRAVYNQIIENQVVEDTLRRHMEPARAR